MPTLNKRAFQFCISLTVFTLCWLLAGCGDNTSAQVKYMRRGRKVEIISQNGRYTLLRNGEPYFIKGAGGYTHFKKIKENGGNSVRVWHTDSAQQVLDEAHKYGLTVTLGLWVAREKEGFNYYDKKLVAQQLAALRDVVIKYKDHPALLMWGVGNEVNDKASNTKVWDAVNEIAEMIHEVDPDHPTTTMLIGVRKKTVNLIIKECPAIDVLSFNIFGGLLEINRKLSETEWKGPYIISEFGTYGYWEAQNYTSWGAPLEQTSTEKAEFIREHYKRIFAEAGRCLGGYVFYWGYKYEGTPTWFSIISEKGEETETIDVMRELWTRESDTTSNKAPHLSSLMINDFFDHQSVYLKPQHDYNAAASYFDPDGDSLRVEWEVLPETFDRKGHSIKGDMPAPVPGAIYKSYGNKLHLKAPQKEGPYRLYVYIYDGQGHVSTANFPFFVSNEIQY